MPRDDENGPENQSTSDGGETALPGHDKASNRDAGASPGPDLLDLSAVQNAIRSSFESWSRSLAETAQLAVSEAIASVAETARATAARQSSELARLMEDLRKQHEEVFGQADRLGKLAWTLPMNADLDDCRELLDAATDAATLDAAFEKFYAERDGAYLDELLRDVLAWPLLERWRPVLEEARKSFDLGLFRVTVAALIPVLDGLAHRGWDREFFRGDRRREFFAGKVASQRPASLSLYLWRSTQAFVDTFFANTFGDVPPDLMNRHWILHGLMIPSGKRIDCIRVLQAIHTFAELVARP